VLNEQQESNPSESQILEYTFPEDGLDTEELSEQQLPKPLEGWTEVGLDTEELSEQQLPKPLEGWTKDGLDTEELSALELLDPSEVLGAEESEQQPDLQIKFEKLWQQQIQTSQVGVVSPIFAKNISRFLCPRCNRENSFESEELFRSHFEKVHPKYGKLPSGPLGFRDLNSNIKLNQLIADKVAIICDGEVKNKLRPIEDPLGKMKQLIPGETEYNEKALLDSPRRDPRPFLAINAQNIEEVLPNAVSYNPLTGERTVNYIDIVTLTVAGVQALAIESHTNETKVQGEMKRLSTQSCQDKSEIQGEIQRASTQSHEDTTKIHKSLQKMAQASKRAQVVDRVPELLTKSASPDQQRKQFKDRPACIIV